MTKKKMGMSNEVELIVEDEQSGKEYRDEDLIPKLKKVVVARRVVGNIRALEPGQQEAQKLLVPPDPDEYEKKKAQEAAEAVAKAKAAEASEAQSIFAAVANTTKELDISKYMNMPGRPRFPYHGQSHCYRCGKPGHISAECLSGLPGKPRPDFSDIQVNDVRLIKKATGIPKSDLMLVDGPHYQGAVVTSSGQYAVPKIDARAHNDAVRRPGASESKPPSNVQRDPVSVPPELKCGLCNDLLRDAVLTLCCNESFCDECIRDALLSSDEHLCPKCQKTCAPASLVPNLNIRNFVRSFANENNYTPLKMQSKSDNASANESTPLGGGGATPGTSDSPVVNEGPDRSMSPLGKPVVSSQESHPESAPPVPMSVATSTVITSAASFEQPTMSTAQDVAAAQAAGGVTLLMMPQLQQQFPGNFLARQPFVNPYNALGPMMMAPQAKVPLAPTAGGAYSQQAQMAMMQAFVAQLRPIMAQYQFNEQQQQQFLEQQMRQFQEQLSVGHADPGGLSQPPGFKSNNDFNFGSDAAAIERFLKRDIFPRRQFDQRTRRRSRSRSPRRRSRSRNRSRTRSRSPSSRRHHYDKKESRRSSRSPSRKHHREKERERDRERDRRSRNSPNSKSSKSSAPSGQKSASSTNAAAQMALSALKDAGLNMNTSGMNATSKMSKSECEKAMNEWFEKVRAMHGEKVEELYRTAYQPYIDALLAGAAEKTSPSKENEQQPPTDGNESKLPVGENIVDGDEKVTTTNGDHTHISDNDSSSKAGKKKSKKERKEKDEKKDKDDSKKEKEKTKDKKEKDKEKEKEKEKDKEKEKEKEKTAKEKEKDDGGGDDDGGDSKKRKKKSKEREKIKITDDMTEEQRKEAKRLNKEAKETRRRERAEKKERKLLKKQHRDHKQEASMKPRDRNERSKSRSPRFNSETSTPLSRRSKSASRSRSRSRSPKLMKKSTSRDRSSSTHTDRLRNENHSGAHKYSSSREKERSLESYVVPANYATTASGHQRTNTSAGGGGSRRKY